MANFEAFRKGIKLSSNLLFLKSVIVSMTDDTFQADFPLHFKYKYIV